MIKKLTAITAIYILTTFVFSYVYNDSYMPMLISAGIVPGIIKGGLLAGLILAIRKSSFKYKLTSQLVGILGIVSLVLGFYGMASIDVEYFTYPYLMSMDYVTMAEVGVLLCLISLTYKYRSAKYALHLPTLDSLQSAQLRLIRTQRTVANLLLSENAAKRATSLSQRRTRLAS